MKKFKLLMILAFMPDEAFGWFVMWASIGGKGSRDTFSRLDQAHQMFPDGLGGFQPASRDAIERLRKTAKEYLED